jgi:predicted SprT family Zn-dependent metalloprotease
MNDTMPKNMTEAKARLEEKMIEVLQILETKTGKPMPLPEIHLKSLGLRFGVARRDGTKLTISINSDLITEKHWSTQLNDTLPHEVCHHVAPLVYNRWQHGPDKNQGWSHGRAWQHCMTLIGLTPNLCGDIDSETRQTIAKRVVVKKYGYKCGCEKLHFLTKIKHNRFMLGKYNRLHCRRCKVTLVYVGEKIG